jgi:hypothetical protein
VKAVIHLFKLLLQDRKLNLGLYEAGVPTTRPQRAAYMTYCLAKRNAALFPTFIKLPSFHLIVYDLL